MENNIIIQNTISVGIEIPQETFINEKTINVQNLIIESSSTNNGTICIPDNASNNIVVPSKKKKIFIVHDIGETITGINSSTDRVGYVIAQSDTVEKAIEACVVANNMIKVEVE